MSDIMAQYPYMTCPGNHEAFDGSDFANCTSANFTAYRYRFKMPTNVASTGENMFFSFNYMNTHFVSVNTETDYVGSPEGYLAAFGPQLSWLMDDLSKVNRSVTPWVIIGGHRPIYSSSVNYSENGLPVNSPYTLDVSLYLQQAFEDIYYKYQVDLVFTGHVHAYERQFPVYRSMVQGDVSNPARFQSPSAPIYVISGAAGGPEGLSNANNSNWVPIPSWCAHRFGDDYGFGVLKILSNTQLTWQWFRAGDGGVEDYFEIQK